MAVEIIVMLFMLYAANLRSYDRYNWFPSPVQRKLRISISRFALARPGHATGARQRQEFGIDDCRDKGREKPFARLSLPSAQ